MDNELLSLLSTRTKTRLFRYPRLNKKGRYPLPYRPQQRLLKRLSVALNRSETAIASQLKAMRRKRLQEYGLQGWMLDL